RLVSPAGPGIREDSGVYEGWQVPLDYDPMLSKLIAYAPTRKLAIARARRALDEYFVGGIKTNISLFRRILDSPEFVSGNIDTGFLDGLLARSSTIAPTNGMKIAAIAAAIFEMSAAKNEAAPSVEAGSEWKRTARRESLRDL